MDTYRKANTIFYLSSGTIAAITSILAIWSFFFMFNTATAEIFDGNWYGLLCVFVCLGTFLVAYLIYKGIGSKEKRWFVYAMSAAIVIVVCAFGFTYDYDRHYDNWVDGFARSEFGPIAVRNQRFDVYPYFMRFLLFGYGCLDLFFMTLLGYTLSFIVSLCLFKLKIKGQTVWKTIMR